MAKTYKKISGTWTPIKYIWKNIGGTWTKLKKAYKKVSGTWQQVYSGTVYYTFTSSITATATTGIPLSSYVNPDDADEFVITVNSGVVLSGKTGTTGAHGFNNTDARSINNCHGTQYGNGGNGGTGGTGYYGIDFTGFSGKTVNITNNGTIKTGNGGNGGNGGNAYSDGSAGNDCVPTYGGCGGAGGAGGSTWNYNSSGVTINVSGNSPTTGTVGATGTAGANGKYGCTTSCFLSNSNILMANKKYKNLIDVKIGEKVIGAFGEINEVIAIERVLLNNRKLYNINNEHYTTDEHPHITIDKKFYAISVDNIYNEWGGKYPCTIDNDGTIRRVENKGLNAGRVQKMKTGIILQTINGGKLLETITAEDSDEEFVYNLIVDGSHTYTVDGYAVTSFPREDDFNYDKWEQKERRFTIKDYL